MKERVGSRHWLFLGMLAQMPGEAMHLRLLTHLGRRFVPGVNGNAVLENLASKGLVAIDHRTKTARLTEAGATRRRQLGRKDTPWFARVPDQIVRQAF